MTNKGADNTQILASAALFMVAGPALVLVNREILVSSFKYPMFVSGMGVAFTSVFAHVLVDVFRISTVKGRDREFWVRNCLPVGACQVCFSVS